MEKVVEHLSGVPGKKYKFSPQMFEDDPLISTMNRLGEAGQPIQMAPDVANIEAMRALGYVE